jgi:hypothetical protein
LFGAGGCSAAKFLLAHYLRMDTRFRHGTDFVCSALKQAGPDGATANGKRAKKIRE